jgi:hypothetical protein
MPKDIIQSIKLDNGLDLILYDISKKIAGDRWQVGMLARIDIPINRCRLFENSKCDINFKYFNDSMKEKVRYEQKRYRNFIDEKSKNDELKRLIDTFLENSLKYLSHQDFPRKYLLRRYNEFLKNVKCKILNY